MGNVAKIFDRLTTSMNELIANTNINYLVDFFEFDNGFEIIEAIEYYKEREMYNACAALDIIMSNYIHKLFKL